MGATASTLGFPVAIKIISPEASHKTEVGGVQLNVTNPKDAFTAAENMMAKLKAINSDAKIEGFLVQKMVSGIEFLVGTREDEQYGPMLVVGAGGVMVELINDVALRLLPVNEDDIRSMLSELKISELLNGFRGSGEADRDALIAGIKGLSNFYLDHRAWIKDLEINPLMVLPKGQGIYAVDIRIAKRK